MTNKRKYLFLFLIAVGFRLVMYLVSALLINNPFTEGKLTLDVFLSYWCKWDTNHYINIYLWIPQLVLAVVSVLILIYGIKKLRAFHMGYGISYVILTCSATWLLSSGRYLSCCIPLFIVLAIATEKRKWLLPIFLIISSILLIFFYLGYFKNMQVL